MSDSNQNGTSYIEHLVETHIPYRYQVFFVFTLVLWVLCCACSTFLCCAWCKYHSLNTRSSAYALSPRDVHLKQLELQSARAQGTSKSPRDQRPLIAR